MPSTFSWRVLAILGAFLLTAGLGTASAEPREQTRADLSIQSAWAALSDLRDALIAIWSDNGAGLDPFGGEKPTGQSGDGGVVPTLERE